ncbi:mannonate dehydratase [Pseudalkalibacillus decolorationis]
MSYSTLSYFLKVPYAEECGVKLAIHPHEPP